MVVLHVKWAAAAAASSSSPSPPALSSEVREEEEMEFLYECAATSAVEDVAAALAGVAALQARLLSLCRRIRERNGVGGELERAMAEAESYTSKDQVRHNKFISHRALREHIKNIEKIAVASLQESSEVLCLQQKLPDDKHESVQLCWAGKELTMGKKLCDYIGVNEKTKIAIKLTHVPHEH
uniref:Ubiquitin-like domain-containing protein n=1 Tax=Leersia perrieri TaxID=77586 RepID=A0A0D9WC61_9ORYZ